MKIVITNHAKDSFKKRVKLSKNKVQELSNRAFNDGISYEEATGNLKKYLNHLYETHGNGNNIRVYHQYVYIFSDNRLVTILHLPNEYKKIEQILINKRKQQEAC